MNGLRKVSVRQLQHNLSDFLELAKSTPLLITKYGKQEVLLVNPDQVKITKTARRTSKDILSSPFIGMNKNKRSWKGKSSAEIAEQLRKRAWYGQ